MASLGLESSSQERLTPQLHSQEEGATVLVQAMSAMIVVLYFLAKRRGLACRDGPSVLSSGCRDEMNSRESDRGNSRRSHYQSESTEWSPEAVSCRLVFLLEIGRYEALKRNRSMQQSELLT